MRALGKRVDLQGSRGFESPPLRHVKARSDFTCHVAAKPLYVAFIRAHVALPRYTQNMPSTSSFRNKVFRIVAKIPRGSTLTYGEVAARAGNRGAARAVGNILKTNFDAAIPCHRVIRSDGSFGGYNRGAEKKRALLTSECA